jgi:hypothetical protein
MRWTIVVCGKGGVECEGEGEGVEWEGNDNSVFLGGRGKWKGG